MTTELSEWQKAIVLQALKKLFSQAYFDICTLDAIAGVLGVQGGGRLKEELRTLHCVQYADMHPLIREQLPQKVAEYLATSIDIAELERELRRAFGSKEVTSNRGRSMLQLLGWVKS